MINEQAFEAIQRDLLRRHITIASGDRMDADTAFLERELTQLRARTYTVEFAPIVSRQFAPKATDIAASVETYSYKVFEPVGRAKLGNYKAKDIPRVDLVAREVFGKVRPVVASYGWDINELREAARLGMSLPDVKARTCRDVIERGIDQILAFGAIPDEAGNLPDVGLNGLVNNPSVVALGIQTGGYYLGATPEDPAVILKELSGLLAEVKDESLDKWAANTLLLPTRIHTYIQQTPFSALTGESILTVFRRNNPQLTMIAPWNRLDAAGAGGKPRAIAYQRDSSVLEAIIPQEFEVMPPEMQGFEFVHNAHARCGGVKIYQPLAMRYMDFDLS